MGVYGIFIAIAIGIIVSIFIVGFICIMFMAGQDDQKPRRNKKSNKR